MTKSDLNIEQSALDFYKLYKQLQSSKLANTQQFSPARYAVLSFIYSHGAQSLTSIAKSRRVSNATMSKIVSSLVDKGLLLKANSKLDKRTKLFFISRKAADLLLDFDTNQCKKIEQAMCRLSLNEQRRFIKGFPIIMKLQGLLTNEE